MASFLFKLVLLQTVLALISSTTNSQSSITTCLIQHGVTNFTAYSSNATSPYSALLNFSVQNMRFSDPTLPKPTSIIFPYTKLHLRNTVACCRRANLAIRIRSGGHSYEGLSYTAGRHTPFAVVDLMNMNRIRIRSDFVWAESGATLGQIYHAVALHNDSLALSAGSCPTVGSGGHIAGGGFGLLSRKYGLAADNVADAILIDYKGRILNRTTMGEDVYWAIRGGGGGTWGAVYAWKLRLRPVPRRVTSFIINRGGSIDSVARLVLKWQSVAPNLPDEFYMSCFVGTSLPDSEVVGISTTFKGFFLGSVWEAITIVESEFPELGLRESDCRETSWIESVLFFSGLRNGSSISDLVDRELHVKTYFKAKSDYVRSPISLQDLISVVRYLATEAKAYVIIDPYGGEMSRIQSDELPFPHRKGNMYAIQYLIEWTDGNDPKEKYYIEWLRGFYEFMRQYVSKMPRAAYINYMDLDLGTSLAANGNGAYGDEVAEARRWGEKYFLENYDRLVKAKTKIDPHNVFCNDQSIPPLSIGSRTGSGHSIL